MKTAIILAAGKSTRFSNQEINKLDLLIKGKPVYMHSVELFLKLGFEVILVTNDNLILDSVKIVRGGKNRTSSVLNGLQEASGRYIYIHDGARPMINEKHIKLLDDNIKENDGIYLAKRVTDSLKKIDNDEYISVNRDNYLISETPQVFKKEILDKAFSLAKKDYTDEVSMLQDLIEDVKVIPIIHDLLNYKITYQSDYIVVKKLLSDHLIGHSFDIHQLVENRDLILGGIKIKSNKGLLGHSDADVLLHAITEAIIGALGLGDLGSNFPDNDPEYKDISSSILLRNALLKMKSKNYGISNIDISMYLEEPKLSKYRKDIEENISTLLGLNSNKINFKITTTEKIGPIGKNEAIAAEVVVLLEEV